MFWWHLLLIFWAGSNLCQSGRCIWVLATAWIFLFRRRRQGKPLCPGVVLCVFGHGRSHLGCLGILRLAISTVFWKAIYRSAIACHFCSGGSAEAARRAISCRCRWWLILALTLTGCFRAYVP